MAPISINVVSTFLIVLIGSLPCESFECTWKAANWCQEDYTDRTTYCVLYKQTNMCLEKLLQNCKDDNIINSINSRISANKRYMTACPGYPKCYNQRFYDDCEMTSTALPRSGQDKELLAKKCTELSGKSSDVRTCAKNLKLKCPAMLDALDVQLKKIDKAEKVCADLE